MKSLLRYCAFILSIVSIQARYVVEDSVLYGASESYTDTAIGLNGLFSCTSTAGLGANALTRVAFINTKGQETETPQLLSLAQESVFVNGAKTASTADSIYDKSIVAINVVGDFPVVAYDGAGSEIAIITDSISGKSLIKNTHVLNDAAGNPLDYTGTAQTTSVAMSSTHVFAAVQNAGDFSDGNDGIAVLKIAPEGIYSRKVPTGLAPINANTGSVGNVAALVRDSMTETDAGTTIKKINHVYWDAVLKRLFISLELDSINGTSVLVGRMSGDKLTIEPIVAGNVLTTTSKVVSVTGLLAGATSKILQTCVMHTSTGKSYAIVWGNQSTNPDYYISALPLISQSDTPANIGKLAKISDLTTLPEESDDLYDAGTLVSRVGGINFTVNDKPNSVHVLGDSVFIARNSTVISKRGIYKSTALFDKNGTIRGWTEWEKVLTDVSADEPGGTLVKGFSYDPTGRLFTQSTTDRGLNAVSVHTWGTADANGMLGGTTADATVGIISKINSEFPAENGGVNRVVSLPDNSIAVCGNNKVLFANVKEIVDEEIKGNASADYAVVDVRDKAFGGILTSAVFWGAGASTYAVVGGSDGLFFVAKDPSVVFNTAALADLIAVAEIGSFSGIIDLFINGDDLYVCCQNGVYHLDIGNFTPGTGVFTGDITTLATPKVLCGSDAHRFLCFTRTGSNAKSNLLIGTTNGLFRVHDSKDAELKNITNELGTDGWQHIYRDNNNTAFSVVRQLFFIPAPAVDTYGGNCYVLSADTSLNTSVAYRLDIPEGLTGSAETIEPIIYSINYFDPVKSETVSVDYEYFYLIGRYREQIYTDGAYFYDGCSYHHNHKQLLVTQKINTNLTGTRFYKNSWGTDVPLLTVNETVINTLFVEPFTGALMVPGEWGVRVRQ